MRLFVLQTLNSTLFSCEVFQVGLQKHSYVANIVYCDERHLLAGNAFTDGATNKQRHLLSNKNNL